MRILMIFLNHHHSINLVVLEKSGFCWNCGAGI